MLHKKNIQDIYELSPLQKGMYFHALVEAEADPYFSQTTYRVTGPLDTALLERSLQLLVQRHDVLRTVFNHKKADEIIQIVLRERSAAFQLLDLRGLGAEAQEQFIANFQEEDRRRGFQLHQDNLLRVTLIQTAERGFTFVWSAHHIIIDGWCQSLLIGEFQEIYLSLLRGECPDLPPAGQYRAYIEWLGRQDAAAAQTFWKHYLADYEGQHRLFAESPAPQRAYENCEISLDLPEALCDRIRTIGKERGLTLSVLLKSLWGVLLHKYQGTERVLIGQVGASRPAEIPHIDRAIGLFINTTPVILRIDPEASFLALAHRVQAEQLETEAHHFLPLSDIQQQSELRQHLIDHTFIFENFPPIAGAGPEAGTPQVDYAGSYAQTNYAFNLVILPNRSITVKFNYNGAVLPQQKVAGLVDHFSHLLEQVGAEPEQKIGSLRLLRQAEVRELLERNGTMVTYPAVGHAYASFLQVTIRHADRLALVDGETSWTYCELAQQASRVGHLLRQNERFAPGKTVAVFLDRSPASVAVLLGIWQAGGIYLPIATDQARERVAFMLADAEAVLTISEAKYLPQLRDWQIEAIDHRDCADYPDTFQEPRGLELSDTAYLIYTSGTTGRPKGVPIRHESILNQILFHNEYLEMAVGERFLHLASLAFDASLVEILMPLFSGGTLVVAGQALKENTDRLLTFLKEQRVNAAIFPPAYLRLLDRVEQTELRKVISTGEAILTEDALRFADRLAIYNGYGPTECCIGATFHRVDPSKRVAYQKAGGIPIGKPFANTSVYIVGPQLELLPEGRIGEICVAGTGLSQGYWKRSDLTADKFAPNPYARFAYERQWYRTGDLGRWNAAGELEFCGRIDDQLQLSGIRVEPQEIARGIRALTAAKRVVVDQVQRDGSAVLCAFVEGAVEVDERILRQSLREHLPAYMIPQRLLYWEAFPLTANGKVDKAQLLQGLEQSAERPTEGRMPRSPEGQLLCQTIAQCLQCPVDLDTDFFYVGGDSIKAIQIVSRLYRQGYALEVKSIFKYPIIEQLLTQLKPLRALAEQGVVKGAYPLSPIQQEFFQLPLQHPEHFNHAELFTSQIPLREEEVRRVLQKLLEHHDGLRSTFARDAQGQWRARIEDAALRPRLLSFDLRQEADVPARRRELSEQLQSAFQLDQGPLLQAAIFRDRQGDQLLIVVHHLVFDGISWRIFMEDLQLLFEQVRQGQPLELPPKTDSYQSWTKALQAYAGSESLATDRDYWSQRVAGKVIPLEPDTAEGVTATTINLSVGDTQQLRMRTVKAYGTELNTLLVALLGRAVQRTWGLEQVALMLEGHGRVELFPDLQISRTIGWFTSLYPCTLPSGAGGEWTEWIKAVQTQLKAIPNQGIGYGILQGLAREPLEGPAASRPNLLFNYLGAFEETTEEGAILRALDADLGPSSHPDEKPTFGLSVNAWIEDNVLSLRFQYDRSAHRRERIEQLARAYETALRNLLQSTPGHSTRDEQLERQLQAEYPNGVADFYPLSPMQEALYFQALSQPDSTAYLYQVAYPIEGPLEVDQVRDSLEKLVARHAILRTVFRDKLGDRNWQIVLRSAEIDLRYEDYSVVSTAEQERKIEAYLEADRGHLFDLAKGPLLRVSILRTSPRHFHFVWTSHHILMDGWCFGVLVEEFLEIYRAAQEGTPPQLPTVRPYRDFIDWLSTQDQTGAEAYWQEYLRGFERTTGLGHRSKAAQRDEAFSLARTSVTLTPARTQAIYDRCRQWHVTPSLFLQTAWALLLARYNYTQDVVFGKTVAGRPPELEGIEQMTGLFVNTIPVRLQYRGEQSFLDLLRQQQAEFLDSQPHHYCAFTKIQKQSVLQQGLLDHSFVVQNVAEAGRTAPTKGLWEITGEVSAFEHANFDLCVVAYTADQINIDLEYNARAFDAAYMDNVARHLDGLLDRVMAEAEAPIASWSLIRPNEGHFISQINATQREWPAVHVLDLLGEQVIKNPQAIALTDGHQHWTYQQLDQYTNQMAQCLLARYTVQPGDRIALRMERSPEAIALMIGILKTGASYLAIDRSFPTARMQYILTDSAARLLLFDHDEVDSGDCPRVNLAALDWASHSALAPAITVDPQAVMYTIYTSGSTGQPKGVQIRHASLVNYLLHNRDTYQLGATDHSVLLSSMAFDLSYTSIWTPLVNGARLSILPESDFLVAEDLLEILQRDRIRLLKITPSAFKVLVNDPRFVIASGDLALRMIVLGGEKIRLDDVQKYLELSPGPVIFVDEYGPTEATIGVANRVIDRENIAALLAAQLAGSNIGRPIANTELHVLDLHDGPAGMGMIGELCIAGAGLAAGYWRRPALTAERFVAHPQDAGLRLYRTGDLARWLPEGELEFLGRRDHQVKVRGYRVEVEEIEAIIRLEEVVDEVVVLPWESEQGVSLAAYVLLAAGATKEQLRPVLEGVLPSYMMPHFLIELTQLPQLPNGKIDRRSLPDPQTALRAHQGQLTRAERPEEKLLVEAFEQVMKISPIGLNDDFFSLGGDSVQAMQIIAYLYQADYGLEIKDIFMQPLLADLVAFLQPLEEAEDDGLDFDDFDGIESEELDIINQIINS